MSSDWGSRTFGDPCRDCGFDWSVGVEQAVASVIELPSYLEGLLEGLDASRRHPDLSWSIKAYVCHVGDNLRIAGERLVGVARGGDPHIQPYDQDLLSQARRYEAVPIDGALWSLRHAVRDWAEAIDLALRAEVVLLHPERGPQTALDVCRTNAHDSLHHLWDIDRSIRSGQ